MTDIISDLDLSGPLPPVEFFIEKDGKTLFATEEQVAIINASLVSKENILIDALAGAAKTSTLEFLCKYLPKEPILSIAFNRRIAEEMAKRLPPHVKCATINSVGHNVWRTAIAHRIQVDKDKTYNIVKSVIEDIPSRREKSEAYEVFGEIRKLVGRARHQGYIPDGTVPHAKRIISTDDFWSFVEEEDDELVWCRAIVDNALTISIGQAYRGLIDFDDQIYMPTLFGGTFPQYPIVMVDEAQDLSRLNHAFLQKLAKNRLFAVGDQRQSIYGFRGAVASGMSQLQRDFHMRRMELTVSFRCPIKIVENARFHAPHMKWAEGAIEGSITAPEIWDANCVPDNAAIICRNNAPLFSLGFKLLRSGRGVKLVGFDLGPGLIKILKKFGPETMSTEELHRAINAWERDKLAASSRGKATVKDKAECLRVFADFGNTLGQAVAYTEHLFKTSGTIQLLSGHKAKGLEWDVVYHLDPHRIPSPYARTEEEQEQERNIRYVIETRSKRDLVLVHLEDFQS